MRRTSTLLPLMLAMAMTATACTGGRLDATVMGDDSIGSSTTTTITVGDGSDRTTSTTLGGSGTRNTMVEVNRDLDTRVAAALASFGPWRAADLPPFEDGRALSPYTFTTSDRVKVSCDLSERAIPAVEFEEFATFPFSGDRLPGLIVEGGGIEAGDLRPVPLDRAPMTLVVNLNSATSSVVVDDPDPAALQAAVADLARAADARVTGLPVVPANIRFFQRTVSSFEEASLAMGVSLRYRNGGFGGTFGSEFEQSTTSERHTVVARLVQPMFTISVDRSSVADPGGYFDPAISYDRFQAVVDQGRIGAGNPPVLIDAVTYGRVVYLTVSSDKVTSADELELAVSGAYGGFSGDAEVANKNRRIMQSAEIEVEALGGDDDVALRAIREGTIQSFMESVNTATAAPLTMVLRTLDGTKLTVTDEATVTDIGCRREVLPNKVEIQITTNDGTWGVLWINGSRIRTVKTSERIDITDRLRSTGTDEVQVVFEPTWCIGGTMTVSYLVNGATHRGTEWRLEGTAGEWVCKETVTWSIDKGNGIVRNISGPPALQTLP